MVVPARARRATPRAKARAAARAKAKAKAEAGQGPSPGLIVEVDLSILSGFRVPANAAAATQHLQEHQRISDRWAACLQPAM